MEYLELENKIICLDIDLLLFYLKIEVIVFIKKGVNCFILIEIYVYLDG